jgi:hypothetical protein
MCLGTSDLQLLHSKDTPHRGEARVTFKQIHRWRANAAGA